LIVTGGSAAKIDRNCKDLASKKIKMSSLSLSSSSWCEETPSVFVHTANPRVFLRQDRQSKLRYVHLFVDPMTKNSYNKRMYALCMYVRMYFLLMTNFVYICMYVFVWMYVCMYLCIHFRC
jgi:hypothetical protein